MNNTNIAMTAALLLAAGAGLRTANADDPLASDPGSQAIVPSPAQIDPGIPDKEISLAAMGEDESWTFQLAPYLWLPAIDGDVGIRNVTANVDWSIDDWFDVLFDELDLALLGRFEAHKGDFGLSFDLLYMSLTEDRERRLFSGEVELEQLIAEFGASYRLGDWVVDEQRDIHASFEALGGLRYTSIETELDVRGSGPLGAAISLDRDEDWLDPFIGGRLKLGLAENLDFVLRGDIGGFGVGSDLTWNLVAGVHWQVAPNVKLAGGYRVLDIDYEDGAGADRFVFDAQMKGPMLGVIIEF